MRARFEVAIFAGIALSALAASAQTLPAATTQAASPTSANATLTEHLRDGRIDVTDLAFPSINVRWGRAVGIVDAPPEKVWAIATDYSKYSEFLPHFKASRVLSRRGNQALIYLEALAVRETVTLWSQMRVSEHADPAGTQTIDCNMTSGNVDHMAARWEITPTSDGRRSILAFQFLVDPSIPFPSSIITEQNRQSASKTVEAMRRRVTEIPSP